MKMSLLLAVLLFLCRNLPASEPAIFEMHAVADKADATKKMYSMITPDHRNEVLFLEPEVLLNQTAVKSAWVEHDKEGAAQVHLLLTEEGKRRFADVTEKLLNKRLGIVVEGQLRSAPVIRTKIFGGEAIIYGNLTEGEAADLADKLNRVASK